METTDAHHGRAHAARDAERRGSGRKRRGDADARRPAARKHARKGGGDPGPHVAPDPGVEVARTALPPPAESLWERFAAAPARALILDYDGTLAPFRADRRPAVAAPGAVAALKRVVGSGAAEVVIVTGRPVLQVRGFLGGVDVEIFGAHGWERRAIGGRTVRRPLDPAQESVLAEAHRRLSAIRPRLLVERKHSSVAVHLRGLDPGAARAAEAETRSVLQALVRPDDQVVIRGFDGGVELYARGFDKGTAVRSVLERLGGGAFALYLGDDLADEDAFREVRHHGAGILVGPSDRPTEAAYRVDGPSDVVAVVARVATLGALAPAEVDVARRRGRIIVVSNRLPEPQQWKPALPHRVANVGGLVSALRPALERAGRALWLGWSGKGVNRGAGRVTRTRVGKGIEVLGVDLAERDVEGHYEGYCNRALWPLFHGFADRASFEAQDFESYRRVNALFARKLARRLGANDRIWVHDYQCIPLGAELRNLGFKGRIGFFLHIPFPPSDTFAILPGSRALAQAFAAYDVVGFHTEGSVANYARAMREEIGATPQDGGTIGALDVGGRAQLVRAYPIGIDPALHRAWADEYATHRRALSIREGVRQRRIILGVDRLDYTKGIPDRLRAFERLLEMAPALRNKVSMIQISAPTRTRIAEYARQRRQVEELVGHINGRFGAADWVPIRYLYRAFSQRELAAFYREADVCLVSPLRDGMNLVAKEFVISQGREDPGVLVLSRFAGAAEELREALIVNPYDHDGTAKALAEALAMPLEDRRKRLAALVSRVESRTARDWAERFDRDLASKPS